MNNIERCLEVVKGCGAEIARLTNKLANTETAGAE